MFTWGLSVTGWRVQSICSLVFLVLVAFVTSSCREAPQVGSGATPPTGAPPTETPSTEEGSSDRDPSEPARRIRVGDEISVCGNLFHTGTRVVLWNDPGGYDAYQLHRHFAPEHAGPEFAPGRIMRYGARQKTFSSDVAESERTSQWTLEDLRRTVSQVVIHYDACGTSRRCFEVLHDLRGLSCHFLLDADGTIYQTLDLKERAWHAAVANARSIGIEMAHFGAKESREEAEAHYRSDEGGPRLELPESFDSSWLVDGFVARPARSELAEGTVNGNELFQHDFTEEQYVAIERLLIAICRIFPRNRASVSARSRRGVALDTVSDDTELHAFRGILGHQHVTDRKVDPGPAFDWSRIRAALDGADLVAPPASHPGTVSDPSPSTKVR